MEDEVRRLAQFCRSLGADDRRAGLMADRLLKRADQLSRERGIAREEALEHLLNLLVFARRGEVWAPGMRNEAEKKGGAGPNPHKQAE